VTQGKHIIVALDFAARDPGIGLGRASGPARCRLKVGKELFTRCGPAFVEVLQERGFEVFLDLKFHDIPNTVAGACAAAADLGVWMVNLHISGGARMIEAARARLDRVSRPPLLIGVTLLTSLGREDLSAVGCPGEPASGCSHSLPSDMRAGLDGVVCSPLEAAAVRAAQGPDFDW
jgi:orotidine-5'-phosphate decarboxylase